MVMGLGWFWHRAMHRRMWVCCMGTGVSGLVGAVLALPLWGTAWDHWQAHRERQDRIATLEMQVRNLPENLQTQPQADALQQPTLSPDELRMRLQAMLTAQGLQVRHVQLEPPLSNANESLPLCQWQVVVVGTAVQWSSAYRQLSDRLGAVMDAVAWETSQLAGNQQPEELHVQLVLPCEVALGSVINTPPTTDNPPTTDKPDDAFSLLQWQALHRQRLQSHPRAQAMQRFWSQPASVLNTVTTDQMHYVGYMHNAQRQVALLQHVPESGAATLHTVRVGQSVGAHWGEVTRISQEVVEVQEWLPHTDGTWRSHRVVWPLQRPRSSSSSSVVRP
jgi:Tfp pilus assembly protein PilP